MIRKKQILGKLTVNCHQVLSYLHLYTDKLGDTKKISKKKLHSEESWILYESKEHL